MEEMFITPIQPISLSDLTGQDTVKVKGEEGIAAFKSVFEEAIDNVRTTEDTLAKNEYLLATGQMEDPHTVAIASSEAQLASDVLVSLRNKALEAYNEIMRINL